jgi:outer membrane phospholipase A
MNNKKKWNIYAKSSLFRDTNYNPCITLDKPYYSKQ